MMRDRLAWIDMLKGLCMICVYLLHSQALTNGGGYGGIASPFYVNAFFFVSGYLFLKNRLSGDTKPLKTVGNVLFKIIIPTIIFSILVYLPKIFFHEQSFDIGLMLFDTLGGVSFWFTSALAVSQLAIVGLLLILNRATNKLPWLLLITCGLFVVFSIICPLSDADSARAFFPWYYRTGLSYTFLMAIGGLYAKYEDAIDRSLGRFIPFACGLIWLVSFVLWYNAIMPLNMMGLGGKINAAGAITIICSIITVVYIVKRLPTIHWLGQIGEKSIVFYFFSGAVPAACATLAAKLLPETNNYGITLIVCAVSCCISYAITMLIYRFTPFLIDLRNIIKH